MGVPTSWLNLWGLGQEIRAVDLQAIGEVMQDLAGFSLGVLTGQTTLNGNAQPLTISLSGGTVTLAPTATTSTTPIWLCRGRLVAQMTQTWPETPPGATLGRIDIFQAQTIETPVNPFSVLFQPGPALQTANQMALDAKIEYKQGVDSGTPTAPAADAGFVAVAQVVMPAAGGNPTSAKITIPSAPLIDALGGIGLNGGAGPFIYAGIGAPTFSAKNGSMFLRFDGGTGARRYVNTSGSGTSGTTWTAIAGE